MARRHNTKHPERGKSRYRQRLQARGVKNTAGRMEDVDTLRKRQRNTLGALPAEWASEAAGWQGGTGA